MPMTPPKACTTCGKPDCKEHMSLSATRRGYGKDWQKLAREWLADNPECAMCGRIVAATARGKRRGTVDHVIPHRGRQVLRLARWNLQTLCASCHSKKTAQDKRR